MPWFSNRKKVTPAMENTAIKIKDNGPLVITGDVVLLDGEDNCLNTEGKTTIGLCRCGLSANKPYCDGSHHGGFESVVRVPPTEEAPAEEDAPAPEDE